MKKCILGLFILFTSLTLLAQNPKGFDAMCNGYIEGTVPLATPKQVNRMMGASEIILLDAREAKEYNISHIKGALKIGYDNFNLVSVKDLDKSKPVYVYCSIGYRSEKIGEKLQKAGFKKVYNLYGGIFNWANSGYVLVDDKGKSTKKVHGYNYDWSKWLNGQNCTKIVD
jgi:rhodanese-related sulfurtransferase